MLSLSRKIPPTKGRPPFRKGGILGRKILIRRLVIITLLMFGFSFALVPLYNALCKVTGLNGKVDLKNAGLFSRYKNPDLQRAPIVVEFDSTRNQNLDCDLSPEHASLSVIPGVLTLTSYKATNRTQKPLVVQAIPSISPGIAAQHLKKLECFCFNQQILQPGEVVSLPLRFWLEPEIPDTVHRLTLSYTLFEIKG
jgi:cytochrome c oxidase assembly protein subunit 11